MTTTPTSAPVADALTFALAGGDLPNGSAEDVAIPGVLDLAKVFDAWTSQLDDEVRDAPSPDSVPARVKHAASGFHPEHIGARIYEARMRGIMLGALDVDWELESDRALPLEQRERDGLELASAGPTLKGFTQLPFQEALDAFRARKPVTRRAWDKMTEAQRRFAFTVAGDTRRAYVEQVQRSLYESLEEGVSVSDFRARLGRDLAAGGFGPAKPHHVETVYRTNLATAYGDGRRARMSSPEVARSHPFWEIRCVLDRTTRKTHAAANGVSLACDDPFWQRAYPPFGFRCRCTVVARRGAKGATSSASFPQLSKLPDEGFTTSGAPIPPPEPQRPPESPKAKPEGAESAAEARAAHDAAKREREDLPPVPLRELPDPKPRREPWPPGELLTDATRKLLRPGIAPAEAEARLEALGQLPTRPGGVGAESVLPGWGQPGNWWTAKGRQGKGGVEHHLPNRAYGYLDREPGEQRVIAIAKLTDGRALPGTRISEVRRALSKYDEEQRPITVIRRKDGSLWVEEDDLTYTDRVNARVTAAFLRGATHVLARIVRVPF
jgi:SPP1 gp7 family putative phage head morphogenesis protein